MTFKQVREGKFTKVVVSYLAIQLMVQFTGANQVFALSSGPSQPEFNSFTPIGTSDMVDLSSGNFNYNIPVMDVGGYPINLSYDSGVTMDQEASWVGLGWNMNVGQIARNVRGIPDDFKGDEMIYENNMKDNVTIGANFDGMLSGFGVGEDMLKLSFGIGVKYNNYNGFGFSNTGGLSYQVSDNVTVGMNMTASASEGTSINPSVSFSQKKTKTDVGDNVLGANLGVSLNSRKGVTNVSMSVSRDRIGGKKLGRIDYSNNALSGSLSFVDASYTPTKRVGMLSSNYTFVFNIEGELWGIEPGAKFTGYRTSQGIRDSEKYKTERAFGFENYSDASEYDILDFNREKDRTFNEYTTTLPITNNTYDIYAVQGQGVSGMFRPYSGQIGYVFDDRTTDISMGGTIGVEIGVGNAAHWGIDGEASPSNSTSSVWSSGNMVLPKFALDKTGATPAYEKVYFKNVGGTHVDEELNLLHNKLGGYDPIKLAIGGGQFSRTLEPFYIKNSPTPSNPIAVTTIPVTAKIKRNKRLRRNQSIQKLSRIEAKRYGFKKEFSPYSKPGIHDHHTSEVRILKNDGSHYIYGRAAYNVVKKEATFDVSGRIGDCKSALVSYNPGKDNSAGNNNSLGDQYFNRITTPAYAHSYLLTSVLSSDYVDLTNNGPSGDDLGGYTEFSYVNKNEEGTYKWRVPYEENKANYNPGLSSKKDDKANYVYGEKELQYVNKIETKTHVAIFDMSERRDALGVKGENGGRDASTDSKMYKIDKISLYAKPEYEANGENADPIKVAHFVYNYDLCKDVPNNLDGVSNELSNNGGKLTLQKVYFTYRNSKMGMYTPYKFNYSNTNPSYDAKGYDVWGNYRATEAGVSCSVDSPLTNQEYPYVDQSNKTAQDAAVTAWTLESVDLPSGGHLQINYESDDYRHVQDEEAMQMFKVVGAGTLPNPGGALANDVLYGNGTDADYLYVKLDEPIENTAQGKEYFKDRYIRNLTDPSEVVYFRFLLNMTRGGGASTRDDSDFDYVTGYLNFKDNPVFELFKDASNVQYAAIPIRLVDKGDGLNPSKDVNPIARAGWGFGRQNLHRKVYSFDGEEDITDVKGVVQEVVGAVPAILDIFVSPFGKLRRTNIARRFIPNKSWIRLMHPNNKKLGGGCRVKNVKLHDNWDVMTSNDGNVNYKQFYGQEYTYETEEGFSTGVATYEPLGSKENPLVKPFFDNKNSKILLAPSDTRYVEKPIGESFFPSPKVTYSKIEVKNLGRKEVDELGNTIKEVKKHATGKVITSFFTTRDYPTITDMTVITPEYDKSGALSSILNLNVKDHLTLSQGYTIHTNDMDGKMKSQDVFAEGQTEPISGVAYHYENTEGQGEETYNRNQGKLNNTVTTINAEGVIEPKLVGVDYDVINDFRKSKTVSQTVGAKFNIAGVFYGPFFVSGPMAVPRYARHENQIKTAVTTKVIHTSAILREKIAHDAGAVVSTKNLAWDAGTGEVLLTETVNEYDDHYFSLSTPAYWAHEGMDQAANNLDLTGNITSNGGDLYSLEGSYIENEFFTEGDELWIESATDGFKAWVIEATATSISLIQENGMRVTNDDLSDGRFKVVRSGHRNLQSASMASITTRKNPIEGVSQINGTTFNADNWDDHRIVNASGVEYSDVWAAQCECKLPRMQYDENGELAFNHDDYEMAYNPYRYNIKGNWRAKKSYAYLTGRNFTENPDPTSTDLIDPSTRRTGFFTDFRQLYVYDAATSQWKIDETVIDQTTADKKWTFASEVTQYSPFGYEVENKDALKRYSSAQYGYNNKFPIAVGSNTKYKELGFDGFEDYNFSECDTTAHFNFEKNIIESIITVTTDESHTGRKSLKVAPNSSAIMTKQLLDCNAIPEEEVNERIISEIKK